jgi:c-di-AMP phosphodiesterase-like protein
VEYLEHRRNETITKVAMKSCVLEKWKRSPSRLVVMNISYANYEFVSSRSTFMDRRSRFLMVLTIMLILPSWSNQHRTENRTESISRYIMFSRKVSLG